jgi:hypothetical protein
MAAHQLGYADGGLRRRIPYTGSASIMTYPKEEDWLQLLQSSGGLTSSFLDTLQEHPAVMEQMLQVGSTCSFTL